MEFGDEIANFGTHYPEVDTSGVFTFATVPPGRYRIQTLAMPENAYVADIRIGDKSVYDQGFDAGSETGQIDVIVNSNGAQIQGAVRDSGGKPFAFARIALVPALPRRQNIALFKSVSSDANGKFTLRGIAPGEYKLFAWELAPFNLSLSPDFIARYEAQAGSISIEDGGRVTSDVKLIPINADSQ
jgi:hypothetical protein